MCASVQVWAEATINPELRPVHNACYARWHDTFTRIVRRGQRQGTFSADVDPDEVAVRLSALTDGLAIQVLTGADITVTVMRKVLVDFVHRELSV